jgi:MFS family permease
MSGAPVAESDLSYRALFRVPNFGRYALATLLGRGGEAMWTVAMVLFVLERFHSPTLAGLTFFLGVGPGLLLSPLAGALLDRHGRVRLIVLDYLVAAGSLFAIVVAAATGHLTQPLLVVLVIVGGATGMLSAAGIRSLVPLILPQRLWDRGNAADSMGYTMTSIVGPALAGAVAGAVNPEAALLAGAVVFLVGAISLLGIREPRVIEEGREHILRSAASAVRYVVSNLTLRGIAITLTILNLGAGILIVAMPVMVLDRFHGSDAEVGLMFALQGVAGVAASLVMGRFSSLGRERRNIVAAMWVMAAGTLLMAVSPSLPIAAVGVLVIGFAVGPLDVSLFSLRQRAVDLRWMGRAIAVSMSLNFVGTPVGSALSGPLVHWSLTWSLVASAVLTAVAAAAGLRMIPRPAQSQPSAGSVPG